MKMKIDNSTALLDQIRREFDSWTHLPPQVRAAFHELLNSTWSVSVGSALNSCDMLKAGTYKGCVTLARATMDKVLMELTNGKRRSQTPPVQGKEGTDNAAGAAGERAGGGPELPG